MRAIEGPPEAAVRSAVAAALAEDCAAEDVTTIATVDAGLQAEALMMAKARGVVAGLPLVVEVFRQVDPKVRVTLCAEDGAVMSHGDILVRAEGPAQALLKGERTALNFVQRLSGIATITRRYIEAIAGTRAVVLDTRKTTPGLRDLEKYAVRCGGGTNHRRDLAAMAMIKDNHREALAGEGRSLADGVAAIRRMRPGIAVEVEIDSLAQLEDALAGRPEWVLLDNMTVAEMAEAVKLVGGRAKLEASGGVHLETVRAIAETGVDAISVGALTHSAPAVDISLELRLAGQRPVPPPRTGL